MVYARRIPTFLELNPIGFYLLFVQQIFYVYCQCHIILLYLVCKVTTILLHEDGIYFLIYRRDSPYIHNCWYRYYIGVGDILILYI